MRVLLNYNFRTPDLKVTLEIMVSISLAVLMGILRSRDSDLPQIKSVCELGLESRDQSCVPGLQ